MMEGSTSPGSAPQSPKEQPRAPKQSPPLTPQPAKTISHSWLHALRRPKTSGGVEEPSLQGYSMPLSRSSNDLFATIGQIYPTSIVREEPTTPAQVFHGLDIPIPTGELDDIASPEKMNFSQRGSLLLSGTKFAMPLGETMPVLAASSSKGEHEAVINHNASKMTMPREEKSHSTEVDSNKDTAKVKTIPADVQSRPNASARLETLSVASSRAISLDEEVLSRKLRAMYGTGLSGRFPVSDGELIEEEEDGSLGGDEVHPIDPVDNGDLTMNTKSVEPHTAKISDLAELHKIAGGIEDWENVQSGDVDRYGFIAPTARESNKTSEGFELHENRRVSTALMEVTRTKRKIRRSRPPSRARSFRSTLNDRESRSIRSPASVHSGTGKFASSNNGTQTLRAARNQLTRSKEQRFMDEAVNMLTSSPGLGAGERAKDADLAALLNRKKERKREEKWHQMGRANPSANGKGGGMRFDFDTRDPKLISRVWKGIPDRWRASAWYSFLAKSAKRKKGCATEDELMSMFHSLQDESSADDVQIDCDVPRTINSHIMFRRRYCGGQRLLFRVLHALSLYLPDTGYVQGMAALAATLLSYFDEEHAFVMMVRLWQVRGLERLYQSGFDGLIEALDDFEKNWLRGGDVAKKLDELGITSTAYGTRWYLTLFNYSIPFPAQLRVWDVFMLLGDEPSTTTTPNSFDADLDVLHATSAAIIDATREIILDSDFEGAMKVLTSWIPVKDEDIMMRVAHVEWEMRKKRK